MSDAWDRLLPKLHELHDLYSTLKLLSWDEAVMMPPNGAAGRARTVATVTGIAHSRLTSPEIGDLLGELEGEDSLDEVKSASVRVLRREYDKATKVPEKLVREIAETRGHAYAAWTKARPENDFSILEPVLSKLMNLQKQEADALGWEDERYDALLDNFEPGMKTSEVASMFQELVTGLTPIVDKAVEATGQPPEFLSRTYEPDKQMAFCTWLVEQLGYDMPSGRLDKSPHPFTLGIGKGDVRQTTRTIPNQLTSSIYAAIHETGHALYEQGIPDEYEDLPIGSTPSLGMHESQSRLWENQVGRSREFTTFMLPKLKDFFHAELGMTEPDEFYRGVNQVERTLIRVEADEVTYNLHIALRFELETAICRDELDTKDLPEAWDDAMEKHLGLRPSTQREGVLQDMHWSIGAFGYFPTYTLGNLISAELFLKANEDIGDLRDQIGTGDTSQLLEWLREKVHSRAYLKETPALTREILGHDFGVQPLLQYLDEKYSKF